MVSLVPVCPLIQKWSYRFSPGFVVKSKRLSLAKMNQVAIRALDEHGVIYVTGEMFSRERVDRLFCFEHNTGIGKTQWVTNDLIPYLRSQGQLVSFINIEDIFPIGKAMQGECETTEIEGCFEAVLNKITTAGQEARYIVLDECDLLFPSGHNIVTNNAGKTFSFGSRHLPYQRRAWQIINSLLASGKKIVLISWLHPQDASLSASYLGDKGFLRVFDAPIVEIKPLPPDEQVMFL